MFCSWMTEDVTDIILSEIETINKNDENMFLRQEKDFIDSKWKKTKQSLFMLKTVKWINSQRISFLKYRNELTIFLNTFFRIHFRRI